MEQQAPDYFQAFVDLAKALTAKLHVDDVQQEVMKAVGQLFFARDWSLLLLDPRANELHFVIVVGDAAPVLRGMRLKVGEGIAGWVAQQRQGVVINDARGDPRFSPRMDQTTQFNTGSLVAAPLVARGALLGVLELVRGPGAVPFTDADLRALQPFCDFAAIALDNARRFEEVEESTVYDACTGLLNLRFLQSRLPQEVARAARYVHPLSVIFVDLDHFKAVNDTLGHARGNALLQDVGRALPKALRTTDRAIRYGGDEFVMLLPETDKAGALVVAERLRGLLHPYFDAEDLQPLAVSASLGVASYPEDADTEQDLLNAADRALYRAKNQGRNCIVSAARTITPQ